MIALQLPYPVSANVYWRHVVVGKRAVTLVSREAKAYRTAVAALCVGVAPAIGELHVELVLHPRLTAKGEASKVRIDLDNAVKVALDALQGLAFADDAQVVELHASVGEAMQDGGLGVVVSTTEEYAEGLF